MDDRINILNDVISSCQNITAAGTLGSGDSRERDIFFILEETGLKLDYQAITLLFDEVKRSLEKFGNPYVPFCLDSQRLLMSNTNSPLLHVLLYPSFDVLVDWELPSFVAYLFERGQFIVGGHDALEPCYEKYRLRDLLYCEQSKWHLGVYSRKAIGYYGLHRLGYKDLQGIFEKLAYCVRFTITEALNDSDYRNQSKLSYDWNDLFELTSVQPRLFKDPLERIRALRTSMKIEYQHIRQIFTEWCNIYNYVIEESL